MNSLIIYNKQQHNGFSLIEMAIVLLITGILMGAGLSLLAVKQTAAQINLTQTHQEVIKQALISYLGQHKRLPCPVDPANPITGLEGRSSSTLSPCLKYSGVVPYATLGLDRSVALDGWENFIDYVVTPPPTTPPTTPPYNEWLLTYSTTPTVAPQCDPTIPYCSSSSNLTFWPSNTVGALNVTGNNTISGIVVALISHGKNGYGAINIKGNKNDFLAAGTDEKQNINPILGTLANTVVKRDTSDTPASNAFDDNVMILGSNDLTGPLIANDTFQSSQAALIQANNIVLGVIGKQKPCPSNTPGSYDSNCNSPANYYTIPSTNHAPAGISILGVIYTAYSTSNDVDIDATTTSSNVAYTLTAADGSFKAVTFNELKGILLRTGF